MRIIQSANPRPLNLLAVGPGGLVAVASSTFGAGGGVEVWDATGGIEVFTHPTSKREVSTLVFVADRLLIGEQWGEFVALALTNWKQTPTPPVKLPVSALSTGGSSLLVASMYAGASIGGALECFIVEPGPTFRQRWSVRPSDLIVYVAPAVVSDGSRCAVTVNSPAATGRPSQYISICISNTGAENVALPFDPASPVQQLAFTADGSKLLVRTDSRTVQMFDANTGAAAGDLVHPGRPYVTGVAVHPRGPVACSRTNGTVTLWDAEKREQLRTLDWKAGKLVSVAFSPDGALGAAGTEDGKVIVWDVDL